jgi:hypothetical protein
LADSTYCVYCHISPSGKRYVGITCQDVKARWRNGKGYSNNPVFTRAIRKYGWDAFEHLILFSNVSMEFATSKEKELIQAWKTTDSKFGYNRDEGGFAHSTETRKKIGKAHSGEKNYWHNHKHTEEYCETMSKSLSGRVFTDEHKQHLSESETGEKNHRYGVKASAETRQKMSESHRGKNNPNYQKKMSEEQKKRLSERFKGIYRSKYTEKTREKMSGANNPTSKRVIYNGVTYETVRECAKAIGKSVTTICPYLTGSRKMPEKYKEMGLAYAR